MPSQGDGGCYGCSWCAFTIFPSTNGAAATAAASLRAVCVLYTEGDGGGGIESRTAAFSCADNLLLRCLVSRGSTTLYSAVSVHSLSAYVVRASSDGRLRRRLSTSPSRSYLEHIYTPSRHQHEHQPPNFEFVPTRLPLANEHARLGRVGPPVLEGTGEVHSRGVPGIHAF